MGQHFLARLDVGLPGALIRALLGAAFAWAVGGYCATASWSLVAPSFLALLFGIKVAMVVARRVIPAPAEVRAIWEQRRVFARRYDSYQWRKLLWFGVGILGVAAVGPRAVWQVPLGAACVVSGAIAHFVWARVSGRQAPATVAATIPK